MNARTKVILLVVAVLVILIIGIFAGWKIASLGGCIIGAAGAAGAAGRSLKNDGSANNRGIDGKLRQEGSLNSDTGKSLESRSGSLEERQGTIDDRQGDIREQKATLDRDRSLLEELQNRNIKG